MPVPIIGQRYYRTAEVCLMAGIAKSTLLPWIEAGIVNEAEHRDGRERRLFADDEIDRLRVEVNRIENNYIAKTQEMPYESEGKSIIGGTNSYFELCLGL